MESAVRKTLLDAVADHSAIIEDIHLFEHWVVIRAGKFEMSTRFAACDAPYRQSHETWVGDLIGKNAAKVAEEFLASTDVLRIAVGMACLKCVLPTVAGSATGSAMDFFHDAIREKATCFIGHFAQAARYREEGYPVDIIELSPRPGDIHWNCSRKVLGRARLVFMTGLTLVNGTFGEVIDRTPCAETRIVMGPTVPMTPSLFKLGVHWLGTTNILNIEAALHYFRMGGGSVMYAPEGALQKVNLPNKLAR